MLDTFYIITATNCLQGYLENEIRNLKGICRCEQIVNEEVRYY